MSRDGGIGGIVEAVDCSHSFYVFSLIGKQWLVAVTLARIISYQSI